VEAIDRPTIQRSAADIVSDVRQRPAQDAAAKLEHYGGIEIAAALGRLSPVFRARRASARSRRRRRTSRASGAATRATPKARSAA
jgi:hypothetical protein